MLCNISNSVILDLKPNPSLSFCQCFGHNFLQTAQSVKGPLHILERVFFCVRCRKYHICRTACSSSLMGKVELEWALGNVILGNTSRCFKCGSLVVAVLLICSVQRVLTFFVVPLQPRTAAVCPTPVRTEGPVWSTATPSTASARKAGKDLPALRVST